MNPKIHSVLGSDNKEHRRRHRSKPVTITKIVQDLKNWRQLSDIDFFSQRRKLLDILEHERNRRAQFPDKSYEGKQKYTNCQMFYYPVKSHIQGLTDWEFYHYALFWSKEIVRLGERRMAWRRANELYYPASYATRQLWRNKEKDSRESARLTIRGLLARAKY